MSGTGESDKAERLRAVKRFRNLGRQFLANLPARERTDESGLRRALKPCVSDRVVDQYLEPFDAYCKDRKITRSKVTRALALHRSRGKRASQESLATFFGTLAIFDIDMTKVAFPEGRAAAWQGIKAGVTHIRSMILKRPTHESALQPAQWECLRLALQDEDIRQICVCRFSTNEKDQEEGKKLLRIAARKLAAECRELFPDGVIQSEEDVFSAFEQWMLSVVLFHVVFHFEDLPDENEA